jgi:MFS family permease
MAAMERDIRREERARRGKFVAALGTMALGAAMAGAGFVIGSERTGDEATGWGVLAGIGAGLIIGGLILAWATRPWAKGWRTEPEPLKRDRLQAQRARQLWIFPLVTLAFLFQSTLAVQDILAGEGALSDYLSAPLPVLYAWVVAAIAMGWDHQSRTHRRYLEDELTVVLRSRAIGAAFVVLMTGVTAAFALGLWRPEMGVAALPFVLSAAGATAGIRFAWLDREFGKDG